MPRAKRTRCGHKPKTRGWVLMRKWLKEQDASIAQLAKKTGVESSSAHSWRWRDSLPTGSALRALCVLTGARPEDWAVDVHGQQVTAA